MLAALIAVLVLALPAGASADSLGSNTEFSSPTEPTFPMTLVEGADGNMWFTDPGAQPFLNLKIGKVTPSGEVTEYTPGLSGYAWGIAAGSDGNIWFTEPGAKKVGFIKPAEPETSLKEFEVTGMSTEGFKPLIAAGPDGNLWVTLGGTNGIAKITPAGVVTEYKEGLNAGTGPCSITAGPDGNVWFGDCGTTKAVGKITPAGVITEFAVAVEDSPSSIAPGSDGRLWFSANNAADERLGAITTAGAVTHYKTPTTPVGFALSSLTAGPDGNIWGAETTGENESQKVTITGSEGTFKLGFEGQETGWTGKGTLTSGSTAVSGVTTTTGTIIKQMLISGPGIPANTRVTNCSPASGTVCNNPTSLTLSAAPTESTAEASLSVSLGISGTCGLNTPCQTTVIKEALGKLSTIGGSSNLNVGGVGSPPSVTRTVSFQGKFEKTNVPLMTCVGAGGAECTVETSVEPLQNRLFRITPSGALTEFKLKPATAVQPLIRANALASGPGGNLWYTSVGTPKAIGKFGTEYNTKLTVAKTGEGKGAVTSSPAGINCGSECSAEYLAGKEVTLSATPASGSEFTGWSGACTGTGTCKVLMNEDKEATAEFSVKPGPTNKQTLTLTKAPNPSTGAGIGTVTSKAKGINCASACTEAVGRFYKNSSVTLTAKPYGETSTFKEWKGCDSILEGKCVVSMSSDKAVEAVFAGTSKAILSPTALTLSKGESEDSFGYGTVKATGLVCESECDEVTVLYQGKVESPKVIAPKTVELKALAAFGSKFTGWSGGGCSGTEPTCKVTMDEAKTVTAEFADLPDQVLTVNKPYSGGLGSVMSKQKGIKCANTCTQAVASMPEGAAILLTAKPATTEPPTTFVKWEGGDCEGVLTTTCTVTMDKAETVKPVFSGPVKAIVNPQKLTLNRTGSGYGTVKAAGLVCEALCTSTSGLYYGPVTEPKVKAGAKVVVKAASAPGSGPVSWTGCESNPTPNECIVVMSEAKTVSAKFDELE